MPLSPSAKARTCNAGLATRALLALFLFNSLAFAQNAKPAPKKAVVPARANELTLAGIRPGRDSISSVVKLYAGYRTTSGPDSQLVKIDECRQRILAIDVDSAKKSQVIRVAEFQSKSGGDCNELPPSPWRTGHGLRVGDPVTKVAQVYGIPDSLSPSTRNGEPLELWYYAFDWAGPDVPQVMEVLCTREKDGKPGHVIEITLAAPSL